MILFICTFAAEIRQQAGLPLAHMSPRHIRARGKSGQQRVPRFLTERGSQGSVDVEENNRSARQSKGEKVE